MENPNSVVVLFCFLVLSLFSGGVVEGSRAYAIGFRPNKLFVFGDSYADTGNNRKSASSWKFPYGITFPGKPSGRFSDGVVLTDFVAKYLGLRTPVPYRYRKELAGRVKFGLNFAYGGTGVFDTLSPEPNMTTQIDFFHRLLNDSVYSKRGLRQAAALVSLAGNDYSYYLANNGSAAGFPAFIGSVVSQLAVNLKRIHDLGVRKVAVNALQPLGCLPQSTATSSFQSCNQTVNVLVNLHNQLLVQAVNNLNQQTNSTSFLVLDLYNAFWSVFNHTVSPTFENPLEPCCVGVSSGFSCGSVDENGVKKYTLCSNRESKFFWDLVHPTQQGWEAVYATSELQNSLKQINF